MRFGNWWILWSQEFRIKYIPAEPPCMKGEIDVGRLVIGWQRKQTAAIRKGQ